jgi:hypothetical protein
VPSASADCFRLKNCAGTIGEKLLRMIVRLAEKLLCKGSGGQNNMLVEVCGLPRAIGFEIIRREQGY